MSSLEVLFTPAEFQVLHERDLSETVCIVFDILRATSTMITALAHGANSIVPVKDIPEALAIRERELDVILAGERNGLLIPASLTGSIPFDAGNSPREFTAELVRSKKIVMTTTNGTRALRSCAHAQTVLAGSFLNLAATGRFIERTRPKHLLLVCSGTLEQMAYEDVLGAGALCDLVWNHYSNGMITDSALIARRLFQLGKSDLLSAIASSRNGRRLLARPELQADVEFCAQRDVVEIIGEMGADGAVRRGT